MGILPLGRCGFWVVVALTLSHFVTAETPLSKKEPARLSARRIAETGVIFGRLKRRLKPRSHSQERQLRELAASYPREDFESLEQLVLKYFTQGEVDTIPFQYKVAAVRAVLDYCSVRRELEIEEHRTPEDANRIASLRQEMAELESELETMSRQSKAFQNISMAN